MLAAHTSAATLVEQAVRDRRRRGRRARAPSDPVGPVRRAALLEERLAVDAVGEAPQRDAAVAEVRQHRRRDADVVVDDLALGEPGLGVEHLVEVRQLERRPSTSTVDAGVLAQRARRLRPDFGACDGRLLRRRFFGPPPSWPRPSSARRRRRPSTPSTPSGRRVGWRLRASLAAATLASSAAIRSTTLSRRPPAAAPRRSRSRRRPCARSGRAPARGRCRGSSRARSRPASDSTSCSAMASSLSLTLDVARRSSSSAISAGSLTSSA